MSEPHLRVIHGEATPEDVAAVLVALSSLATTASPARPRSAWPGHDRQLRQPLHPGPDAWRQSSLPG